MLKKRIIPLLLWQDGRLVKTRKFSNPRVVGDLIKTCKVYSDQDADEIIILNINEGGSGATEFNRAIAQLSKEVMMPISVGGGIRSIKEAEDAFRSGADKIVINSAAYKSPELLSEVSSRFGAQAIIASVDFRMTSEGVSLWSESGENKSRISLDAHLSEIESQGFGELMIQDIDADGMKSGYNLGVLKSVLKETSAPVIVAGGAGDFSHLRDAFELGVDAVACGTLFNFGDNNPIRAKAYLRNYGVPLKRLV
jgi:cyclase